MRRAISPVLQSRRNPLPPVPWSPRPAKTQQVGGKAVSSAIDCRVATYTANLYSNNIGRNRCGHRIPMRWFDSDLSNRLRANGIIVDLSYAVRAELDCFDKSILRRRRGISHRILKRSSGIRHIGNAVLHAIKRDWRPGIES